MSSLFLSLGVINAYTYHLFIIGLPLLEYVLCDCFYHKYAYLFIISSHPIASPYGKI
jgi:hypothetical protein